MTEQVKALRQVHIDYMFTPITAHERCRFFNGIVADQTARVPMKKSLDHHSLKVCPPSQLTAILAAAHSHPLHFIARINRVLSSTPLLDYWTGFHWPSFNHYYEIICDLTPTANLSLLLIAAF